MSEQKTWRDIELPEGADLLKKQWFDYANEKGQFQIELFETIDGKFFAIGIPKDDAEKLIVYGSNIVPSAQMAMQVVIDKIEREGLDDPSSSTVITDF